MLINGLSEMPIKCVKIDSSRFIAQNGMMCVDADSISLTDVEIIPSVGPIIFTNQTKNLFLNGITYPHNAETFISLNGSKTENIQLTNIDLKSAKKDIELGRNVKQEAVIRK